MKMQHCRAIALSVAALSAASADQVAAQAIGLGDRFRGSTLEDGRDKIQTEGAARKFSGAEGALIAPGVVVQSSITTEIGYDSNPDEFFGEDTPGAYGAARASSKVGFLSETGATTFGFLGGRTPYQGDDVIDPSRWDFGVAFDNYYRVAPTWAVSGGAFFVRDHQFLIPSENVGGYVQANYTTDSFEYNSVARVDDIEYTEESPFFSTIPPILLPFASSSAFDVRRSETFSNAHIWRDRMFGAYAEVGYADLDYTSQGAEIFLDRDATETWALAGVRYTSPDKKLVADVGWRFNWRDFEAPTIGQDLGTVSNNFFDAKIIWMPNQSFSVTLDVDRKFVEPWTIFAVATEQTNYSIEGAVQLAPQWLLTGYAHYREYKQIDDDFVYEEFVVGSQLSHQWTENVSIYGTANYKNLEETAVTDEEAERIRVGVGTRINF